MPGAGAIHPICFGSKAVIPTLSPAWHVRYCKTSELLVHSERLAKRRAAYYLWQLD